MTPPKHDATATTARRLPCPLLLSATAIALVLAGTLAPAQPINPPGTAESAVPAVTPPTAATTPAAPDAETMPPVGLVKPEDGTFLPVPPGTTYADFVAWLRARRGPDYGINSVAIRGRVGSEPRIELDAEVVVMVRQNEAVPVTLGFTEAILVGVEHAGAGDASYEPFSKESGHSWSLQGRGEHRLKLKLLVPLTSDVDATRLSLTTPADAATTTLDLNVPAGSDILAKDGIIRSTTESEDAVAVNWVGTGGRIDLAWRPKPISADPADLSATAHIFPSVSGKVVQLRTVQRVSAAKGRISTIRILLPPGFSTVDVTGRLVRSHVEETIGEDRFVVVTLLEPTEGTVETTLRVSGPLPTDGRVVLSGFSMPDVPPDAQSGQIVIEPSTAYQISVADSTDGVARMEMKEPGPLADALAYDFSAQPFRVGLQIDPIPASLTVSPEFVLQVAPDRLDLDARFAVALDKGEIRDLRLAWPATGWTVSPIRSGLIQEFRRGNGSSPPVDISVPNSSSFVVPVRANRPYDGGEIEVMLPRLEATAAGATLTPSEAVVCLRHPNNVVVDVENSDDGLQPLMDSTRAAALPEPGPNERLTVFVAPPGLQSVKLNVRRLSREIDVSAFISVRPRDDSLIVDERLDYDIRFDTVSELRLNVPRDLRTQGIQFTDASGRTLPSEVVGESMSDQVEIALPLDRAVIGPFSISARYEVRQAAPTGTTANVAIPLVVPADDEFDSAELRVGQLPHHTVTVGGSNWVRFQSTENVGRERWTATEVADDLALRLRPRPEGESRTFSMPRMLLRTVVERDGTLHTVADCRFDRAPELLALNFPPGLEPVWFRWRGRQITPEIVRNESSRLAEIELGPGTGPLVLSFAFRSASDASIGIAAARRIEVPRFGSDISIERTLWRVTLPESQHLFTMPDGYEAGFRWGLHGGLWTRQTDEPFQQIGNWFGGDLAPLGPEFETGHQYVFARNGALAPMRLVSLSRSLVVLIGAGTAIVLGYLFASGLIPRRRSILIGLGSALLILWAFFPNQVQIFLQPALFGLALVGAATAAEWALRKRQEQQNPQAPSVVEFVTILPGDGSTSAPPATIGSEDPTVLRTARPSELSGPHTTGALSPGDVPVRTGG